MESVANGINKMGDAFTALAAAGPKQVTGQPATSKRSFDDQEEGETDDDDDYDDTDDVRSLLRSASNKQPPMEVEEATSSGSVLQEMDALLEDDDDVGIAVDEKLANITNKTFAKQHAIEAVKKKKEAHKRPKNCEKVIVPKVNKEIWRQMAKQGFTKKRDLSLMNIQSAITKSTCAIVSVAGNLLKNMTKTFEIAWTQFIC